MVHVAHPDLQDGGSVSRSDTSVMSAEVVDPQHIAVPDVMVSGSRCQGPPAAQTANMPTPSRMTSDDSVESWTMALVAESETSSHVTRTEPSAVEMTHSTIKPTPVGKVAPMVVSAQDVGYSVRSITDDGLRHRKQILFDIVFEALPGEITAIIGPSGCGKTSTLNVLAKRVRSSRVTGSVLFNGRLVHRDQLVNKISYVMSNDKLHDHLTVEETLNLAADLRLCHLPFAERRRRVDTLINELELESCRDVFIGGEWRKGVSTGQMKRVAIGMELLNRPSVLFLDEPTTGMDANLAHELVLILRKLARQRGMTVIFSIHQPRSHVFSLFDRLALMAHGRVLYLGEANTTVSTFARLGYQCPTDYNPADFLLELVSAPHKRPCTEIGKSRSYAWSSLEGLEGEGKKKSSFGQEIYIPRLSEEELILMAESYWQSEEGQRMRYSIYGGKDVLLAAPAKRERTLADGSNQGYWQRVKLWTRQTSIQFKTIYKRSTLNSLRNPLSCLVILLIQVTQGLLLGALNFQLTADIRGIEPMMLFRDSFLNTMWTQAFSYGLDFKGNHPFNRIIDEGVQSALIPATTTVSPVTGRLLAEEAMAMERKKKGDKQKSEETSYPPGNHAIMDVMMKIDFDAIHKSISCLRTPTGFDLDNLQYPSAEQMIEEHSNGNLVKEDFVTTLLTAFDQEVIPESLKFNLPPLEQIEADLVTVAQAASYILNYVDLQPGVDCLEFFYTRTFDKMVLGKKWADLLPKLKLKEKPGWTQKPDKKSQPGAFGRDMLSMASWEFAEVINSYFTCLITGVDGITQPILRCVDGIPRFPNVSDMQQMCKIHTMVGDWLIPTKMFPFEGKTSLCSKKSEDVPQDMIPGGRRLSEILQESVLPRLAPQEVETLWKVVQPFVGLLVEHSQTQPHLSKAAESFVASLRSEPLKRALLPLESVRSLAAENSPIQRGGESNDAGNESRSWVSDKMSAALDGVSIAGADVLTSAICMINVVSALFFAIANIGFGTFDVLLTFPKERIIFNRETANGLYTTWVFFIAKNLADLPFQVLPNMIMMTIYYWFAGLSATAEQFGMYLLIVCLTSATAYGFGYLISAASPRMEVAVVVAPVLLVVMLTVCGFFLRDSDIPAWISWGRYLSIYRFGFFAAVLNQFPPMGFFGALPNSVAPVVAGVVPLSIGYQLGMLVGLAFGFRFAAFIFLKYTNNQVGLEV